MPRRTLTGKVVKRSGDKTVSVLVTRQTTHPIYKKIMRVSKKYLAHDADNTISIGDHVKIRKPDLYLKVNHGKLLNNDTI